jgi:hypothetical protein
LVDVILFLLRCDGLSSCALYKKTMATRRVAHGINNCLL